jgi:hypothetical protein
MTNDFDPRDKALKAHADLATELAWHEVTFPNLNRFLACSKEEPCALDGCPICARRLRRRLAREAQRHGLDQQVWTAAYIYPADWTFYAGTLSKVDLPAMAISALNGLEGTVAGRCLITGGINITLLAGDGIPDRWQFSLKVLAQVQLDDEVDAAFCEAFPPEFGRNVLLHQVGAQNFHKALIATYPSRFQHRLFYRRDHENDFGARGPKFRDKPLPWQQQRELMEWQLTYPVGSRLVLRNITKVKRRDMKLRLKLAQGVM